MEEFYPLLVSVVPWVGGAIGGFLLFVLKNRRPLLTYNVTHQRIGMTADDNVHGKYTSHTQYSNTGQSSQKQNKLQDNN